MQQDSGSFWTDIKAYEERLAANPDSFCFARLAEIYLKVGLTDDALHVARKGVIRHPGHIAGQRALAMACHAKGLTDECRSALEQVVTAIPEDMEALKLLGRLYAGSGDDRAAVEILNIVLDLNPDDDECRLELEALVRNTQQIATTGLAPEADIVMASRERRDSEFVAYDDEDEIIEDLDILELDEGDLIEEISVGNEEEAERAEAVHHDPLSTTTLAELYVQQGFVSKALAIYQTILADDPANSVALTRIAELSATEASRTKPWDDAALAVSDDFEQAEFGDSDEVRVEPPPAASTVADSGLQSRGEAGNALATLEEWLENIRRIKACR
ncbi:lipopolysaccharide assembly protein LapB [Geobacter sp. AOG2]|uniref:tetratricopeptide repeat protein n=1 Tax=Geobacter sp. AOG2 TaxID=1566347 RepID=UPI001CC8247D|nr:hypothetical protein [Geobacter sp. AOG2]GFE60859.1 hypothetical protein AOG2_14460 [Geobacter sp. AOG2]